MNKSRKLTYSAVCAALAIVCIAISAFLPLKFTPLMICAMCFFIALEVSIYYGAFAMLAVILNSFFFGLNSAFFLVAFLIAPYSVLAHFIKKLNYDSIKNGIIRAVIVIAFFNAAGAIILLGFESFLSEFLFGFSINQIYQKLGGKLVAYLLMMVGGSLFMIGYDWIFIIAYKHLNKKFKFMKIEKDKSDNIRDVFD